MDRMPNPTEQDRFLHKYTILGIRLTISNAYIRHRELMSTSVGLSS